MSRYVGLLRALLAVVIVLAGRAGAGAEDSRYEVAVQLQAGNVSSRLRGMVALYSAPRSFKFDRAALSVVDSALCTPLRESEKYDENVIGVVARGECPFHTKTAHATAAGLAALIIVNNEDESFPFGDPSPLDEKSIPTIMVGSSFFTDNIWKEAQILLVDLSFDSKEPKRSRPVDVNNVTPFASLIPPLGFFFLACAVISIVGSGTVSMCTRSFDESEHQSHSHPNKLKNLKRQQSNKWIFFLFQLSLVLLFSVLCGVTTLRKRVISDGDKYTLTDISYLDTFGDREVSYNHRETDELIFETLTSTISKNFWDYSLQSSGVIETFQLSKVNYDDDIFIHPPFFVYTMYTLLHVFGIPLVLSSVVFHTLTAALISPLVIELHATARRLCGTSSEIKHTVHWSNDVNGSYIVALLATIIFVTCPIGRLTSQKVWIDNAAAFTATLAAVIHVYLLKNSAHLSHCTIMKRNLLSGFIFGFIALNCKITSIAMMPFLLTWTILIAIFSHPKVASSSYLSSQHLYRCFQSCLSFVEGTLAGHGPWVCLYYSITGRILPNAWPSKQMVQKSKYMQTAVNRNLAAYLIDMFKFSPLQSVGFLFGLCMLILVLVSVLRIFRRMKFHTSLRDFLSSKNGIRHLLLASFTLWPIGFVTGLTIIGGLGGGFQVRFIVPILPATSILASTVILSADNAIYPVTILLFFYSGMHFLFYSLLYSPIFADMHESVFDIIQTILMTPYDPPSCDIKFLKHFGLKLG